MLCFDHSLVCSMRENEIGDKIIKAAFRVHTELGAGLLESIYEKCMAFELNEMGLKVCTQLGLPITYHGIDFDCGYRLDLLVEDCVIIEVKSVEELNKVHLAQMLTYLKLSGCKLGYLINFNTSGLKDGIRRVIL